MKKERMLRHVCFQGGTACLSLPCSLLQLYSADAADSRLILNQHKQHLPEKLKQLPRPQQRPLQLQLQQNCCNWLGRLTFLNQILRQQTQIPDILEMLYEKRKKERKDVALCNGNQ